MSSPPWHIAKLGVHLLAFITINATITGQTGLDPTAGHVWGWGTGVAFHTTSILTRHIGTDRLVPRSEGRRR